MNFLKSFLNRNWKYLVLIGMIAISYGSSINNEFVSDDIPTFVKNTQVQTYTDMTFLERVNVQKFIYFVSYKSFGLNPTPLHVLSIFLHIINVVLFFGLAKKFFSNKISFSGALLFAIHPINSESVLWISSLNYLMSFLLNMIIVKLFLKAKDFKGMLVPISVYILSFIFTTNVWLLLTPFVILFIALIRGDSPKIVFKYAATFLIISFVTFLVLFRTLFVARSEYINEISENMPIKLIQFTVPYSIGSTAKFLIYPQHLTLYHEGEFALPEVVRTSRIILTLVILVETYLFIKQRKLFYVSCMIFVSILPTLSPIRMSNFFAERYLYFGSAFFCILLASLLVYIVKKARSEELFFLLLFMIVVAYIYKVMVRSTEWRDPVTFWEATVRESTNSAGAFNNMGIEYVKAERFEEALAQFQKSVKINPNVPDAQYNIGKILLVAGRYDLAEPYLLNALKLSPKEPKIIEAVAELNAKKQGL